MVIREYFTDKELSCNCGCGLLPDQDSVERLYALRVILRAPVYITSAARCPAHNKTVGGTTGSIHLPWHSRAEVSRSWRGAAFDIGKKTWDGGHITRSQIISEAILLGFTGLGISKDFIHLDDARRPEITVWSY